MNNDRFRFRVWSIEDKCMITNPASRPLEYFNEVYESDFVVMACTGLKDKNGDLIYEGDICIGNNAFLGEIFYRHFAWWHGENNGSINNACQLIQVFEEMEILGNI